MTGKQDIHHYNQSFQKVLSLLNDQQRVAVDQIEGPVLVIAGPGTGKTHILSARIGRILMETDAQAQNILCLTFTDAGVHAMRERLLQFIGPEAHRLHIYTFHSFCNTIIQDNLERFGRQDMEPLSELERVDIIRQLLDELPLKHPLRLGRNDPYFYEKHLQGLFQRMKSEGWSVEYVNDQIDNYLEGLPERAAFIYKVNRGDIKKGALKTAKIEEEIEKMERLRAGARLFPSYQRLMNRGRRYDYDDMILWVLQAFEEHENLLRSYQEQYLYLLIDEYQDTNGAQNEIIRKLVSYWEQPNLFIVGDDDQSIYEFQGARLKNILDFYHTYEDGLRLVVLASNYRSSQPILDTSASLIGFNELRILENLSELNVSKDLKAKHPDFSQELQTPRIIQYPNLLQEEVALAAELKSLQESEFPLGEVAVIYAQHRQVEGLVELLEKNSIPYNLKRKVNILHLPLIRNFRLMLEYFQAEYLLPDSGASALYQILHFPFLEIHPDDIAALSIHQAKLGWDKRKAWRQLLGEAVADSSFLLKSRDAIERFLAFEIQMQEVFTSIGVPAFAERLLNRSGLLKYLLEQPDKAWWIQVFRAFIEFVRKEAAKMPQLTLAQLLTTLNRMDSNRLPIALNQAAYAQEGVNLLTAHSAKGLEFERVYVLDCSSKFWEPRTRASSYQFSLPDTLTFSGEEDALEARRRLLYVAMTRAKAYLQLSFSESDTEGKPLQPAIFINEIVDSSGIGIEREELPDEQMLEAEVLRLLEQTPPSLPKLDGATVDALLEGFQLSVSAMSRYLSCPLAFFYENVIKAPILMSPAAHYGTAMHNTLQRYFERMKVAKGQVFPALEQMISIFEQEMIRRSAFMPNDQYERRLNAGKQHLQGYYQHHHINWKKDVRLEYKPRNVEVEGVPITGSIDKVEQVDNTYVRLLDYKTGSQQKSKLQRPTKANPHGGIYWRQLVFYKLLYENYPANTRMANIGVISYLEPNTRGEYTERSIKIEAQDVMQLKQMITDTYQKIKDHDFYTGCGKESCSWCRLVKQNILADSFAEEEIEGLDD